ncbi:Uncharacterized protein TCAP_06602 [Tolypocladium capitatum]|uniref:Protein PBN1 n=1 Tax=Tolypocladium capitatum TaxID=45235 RepID=A0A2K3Q7D1_9HYPO|nr:Uncharacterized protein TCAP_06602 [Tolypocladium capitatum]
MHPGLRASLLSVPEAASAVAGPGGLKRKAAAVEACGVSGTARRRVSRTGGRSPGARPAPQPLRSAHRQPRHAQPGRPSHPSKTTPRRDAARQSAPPHGRAPTLLGRLYILICSRQGARSPSPFGPSPPAAEPPTPSATHRQPIGNASAAMRERVTFVHPPGAQLDPKALSIQQAGLLGPSVESAREDRLTVALHHLPPELAGLLQAYRDLHLRWSSPFKYDTLEPFSSRLSPGLHVFYAPSEDAAHDPARLCSFLQALGPLACTSAEAFTDADADRRGDGASSYFYQELEDLSAFVGSATRDVCPELDSICQSRMRSLHAAASLDISFNSAAQALKVTAFWPLRERAITVPGSSKRRTEVGILTKDAAPKLEPHEIGVSGVLSVLGEQKGPSPSLFAFPSRHRLSDASFSSEFLPPTGLHPTLRLRLSSNKPPVEDAGCVPHAYLTLPKTIFADRYQFDDELFLASKNLTRSRYTSLPVDLEAPAYTTKTWGSSLLLELAPPMSEGSQAWTAEVPLHLRYLEPSAAGYVPIEVPYPVASPGLRWTVQPANVLLACQSAARDWTPDHELRVSAGAEGGGGRMDRIGDNSRGESGLRVGAVEAVVCVHGLGDWKHQRQGVGAEAADILKHIEGLESRCVSFRVAQGPRWTPPGSRPSASAPDGPHAPAIRVLPRRRLPTLGPSITPAAQGDDMSQDGADATVGGRRAHSGVDAAQRPRRPDTTQRGVRQLPQLQGEGISRRRRVTVLTGRARGSKLEQLEQELSSIKQVVNPGANGLAAWTPPSPHATFSALPEQTPAAGVGLRRPPPDVPTPRSGPPTGSSFGPSHHGSERPAKTGPAESRVLGSHVVSGEDVDWYFGKFLQCYHPFIPILRKRDPDECYEASPTLFWVVLYVACRRYPRDRTIFSALIDHVGREVWLMVSAPAMNLEAIHALLFLCTWPLPNIRFVTDPSSKFAAIAMDSAKLLGCHNGRGSHPHFTVGLLQHFHATDEESSATWLACCLLAQRTASSIGISPPSIQLNDMGPKRALESHVWTDLLAMYEAQRFLNRFHTAMAAQISANGGVPDAVVAIWETEFESVRPLLVRYDTDISRFCLLAAQLEIQVHYFIAPPQSAPWPSLRSYAVRAFNTSRALIGLGLDLEARSQFLAHAPHWVLRSNIDAAAVVVAVLHSSAAPDGVNPRDADVLVEQACSTLLRCSVRDTDLPHRGCIIIETFWSVRNLVPLIGAAPSAWPDRLGAGVTYWCLEKFKFGLQAAQSSTDRVNKALDLLQPARTTAAPGGATAAASAAATRHEQVANPGSDPFQEVDWSMFMDGLGWGGDDAVLSGLP